MLNGDNTTDCEFRMSLNSSSVKHPAGDDCQTQMQQPMMFNGESEMRTKLSNSTANHHENGSNQTKFLKENGDKENSNSTNSNGDLRKRLVDNSSKEIHCDNSLKTNGTETPESKQDELLHWRDMPKHLQFNPYIFTGYRPMLSIWGCINSLFYMHNETINIITHGM